MSYSGDLGSDHMHFTTCDNSNLVVLKIYFNIASIASSHTVSMDTHQVLSYLQPHANSSHTNSYYLNLLDTDGGSSSSRLASCSRRRQFNAITSK